MIHLTQKVKQGTQYTWWRIEFVKRRDLYEHKQSPMDNFTNHGISEEGGSLDAHLRRWHRKHSGGCWEITSNFISWLTLEMKSVIHMSWVSVRWAKVEIAWVQNWISNIKYSAKSVLMLQYGVLCELLLQHRGAIYIPLFTLRPHTSSSDEQFIHHNLPNMEVITLCWWMAPIAKTIRPCHLSKI